MRATTQPTEEQMRHLASTPGHRLVVFVTCFDDDTKIQTDARTLKIPDAGSVIYGTLTTPPVTFRERYPAIYETVAAKVMGISGRLRKTFRLSQPSQSKYCAGILSWGGGDKDGPLVEMDWEATLALNADLSHWIDALDAPTGSIFAVELIKLILSFLRPSPYCMICEQAGL